MMQPIFHPGKCLNPQTKFDILYIEKNSCKRRNVISLMLDQDSPGVLEETLLGSFVGELKYERKYF